MANLTYKRQYRFDTPVLLEAPDGSTRKVIAFFGSASAREFYNAMAVSDELKPEAVCVMRKQNYKNERFVIANSTRYHVYRTYLKTENGEIAELYLEYREGDNRNET
jgi:hypothetical protein